MIHMHVAVVHGERKEPVQLFVTVCTELRCTRSTEWKGMQNITLVWLLSSYMYGLH